MNKIILISMIGMLLLGGVGISAITTMKIPTDNHAPNAPTLDGPRRVMIEDSNINGVLIQLIPMEIILPTM